LNYLIFFWSMFSEETNLKLHIISYFIVQGNKIDEI
jgi:hypothetical protein